MNHSIKTKIACIFLLLILLTATACTPASVRATIDSATNEQIAIRIDETDGKATAMDAILYLKDAGKLDVVYNNGSYGAYITAINGVAERIINSTLTQSEGYAWTLYTSDFEVAYDHTVIEVDGVLCGLSAFGASTLTVKKDALYVWVYAYYNYSW